MSEHVCAWAARWGVLRPGVVSDLGRAAWFLVVVLLAALAPPRRVVADPPPVVWMLGDSVTYDTSPQVAAQAPQWSVVNYGLGGETSLQGLTRAASLLASHAAPDLVVITYGTNDLVLELTANPNYPDWTAIRDNVFAIASLFEAAGTTVVVGQPVGVVPVGPEHPAWATIEWFNQRFDPLRAALIGAGYPAVDLRVFDVADWRDAFHPSLAAHQTTIAPRIIRTVQAVLSGQPTAVASVNLAGAQVTGWARSGDLFFVGAQANASQELVAIDVSSPTAPRTRWMAELGTDVNAIAVQAPYLFVATDDDDAELMVLDLDTGAVVGGYDVVGDTDAIAVGFYGYLLLTTSDNRLLLLDITNPTAPTLFQTISIAPAAPLWRPFAFSTPYAAGGSILAVARGSADPALTVLLATAATDQFLVVANLRDQLTFPDANGDGVWHLSCLGDSNTWAGFYGSWCNGLAGGGPAGIWNDTFAVTNYGELGAQVANYSPNSTHGPSQLQEVLAAGDSDAVVLAFGTNDLSEVQGNKNPWQTLAAYIDLAGDAEAAGLTVFVALTPPIIGNAAANAKIDALNVLIELVFPSAHVLDFHTGFDARHILGDGVHMNSEGHTKRTVRAKHRLAVGAAISTAQIHAGELIVEGIDDARNILGVAYAAGAFTLVDSTTHAIVPGPGCQNSGAPFAATCTGTVTHIVVEAGGGDDDVVIMGTVAATVFAGDGNDVVTGGKKADVLDGQAGNDTVNGAGGHDTIDGGLGNDALNGGDGNDLLLSSLGNDQLHGNVGTDTADYRAHFLLPVTVTRDNVANDGGPGETDNVFNDIEVVTLP
ncbi:MAG: GDSL-type esterase/lipase family protein [Candidatus Binatia bacterium]